MKEKPLVSIIVPVYNTAQHINKCVQSILEQTYQNIEIILVDDGSTDGSAQRCNNLAQENKKIKVYHLKNGGSSHARNYGIEKSHGSYISFIDSDDYISKNMIEILVSGCIKHNAEIGYGNIVRENISGHKKTQKSHMVPQQIISTQDALLLLLSSGTSACDKIYQKKLFKNLRFPEDKLYEDIYVTPKLISMSRRIYVNQEAKYYYVQRETSKVHSTFKPQRMDYIYASKWLYSFVVKKYPELTEAAECFHILSVTTLLSDIYPMRKKFPREYKATIRELRNYSESYMGNRYISRAKKIMIFLDLHNFIWLSNFFKTIHSRISYN